MQREKKILLQDFGGNAGKDWYIEYYQEKKRIRIKGGMNKEKDATKRRDIANAMITNLCASLGLEWGDAPMSKIEKIKSAIYAYIEGNSHLWRKKTIQSYRSKCTVLIQYIEDMGLKDFGEKESVEFETYLRKKLAKSTFNEYVRIFGVIWGTIFKDRINPFKTISPYKGNHKTPALYFQTHQRKRIADTMQDKEPYLWLFVQFIYYSFIRPGEIRLLTVGDIYPEERKILVRAEIAKNKKRQFVHVPKPLMTAIFESDVLSYPSNYYLFSTKHQPAPEPMGTRYMAIRHQKLIKGMGFDINCYKLYSWKHTGAVACYRAGMKLKDLQLQMRHASIEETDGYLRSIGINDVASDIDAIFPEI